MTPPKKPREFWLPLTTLVMNSDENRSNGIHVREVTEPDEKKSLREQVLDFQARWIECAESHTDIEMELRDLKLHSAKVREQTVRDLAKYLKEDLCHSDLAEMLVEKFSNETR